MKQSINSMCQLPSDKKNYVNLFGLSSGKGCERWYAHAMHLNHN